MLLHCYFKRSSFEAELSCIKCPCIARRDVCCRVYCVCMMILVFLPSRTWIESGDCAVLSNILSSVTFCADTRIERLLPDVKKQPLGIPGGGGLHSVASHVGDRCSVWSEKMGLSLSRPRRLAKTGKAYHCISKAGNNYSEFWYGSWRFSINYYSKYVKWAQVVVEKVINNEIQSVAPKVYALTADSSNFENEIFVINTAFLIVQRCVYIFGTPYTKKASSQNKKIYSLERNILQYTLKLNLFLLSA